MENNILFYILTMGCGVGAIFAIIFIWVTANLSKFWWIIDLLARIVYNLRKDKYNREIRLDVNNVLNKAILQLRDESPTLFDYSLNIRLVNNTDEMSKIKDGEVVLYLKNNINKNKILVNATMLYLQDAVLRESRPYIDLQIMKCVDATLAQKMLIGEHNAYQYLQNEHIEKLLQHEITRDLYQLTETLNDSGVLTRIVLFEYSNLAYRLKGRQSNYSMRQETINFARFVERVVNRPTNYVPLSFYGQLFITTVALVANYNVAQVSGLPFYKKKFRQDIENGTKIIHLLSRGTSNVQLSRHVARWALEEKLISKVIPLEYYEFTSQGERTHSCCITCFSNKANETPKLSPVHEISSALAELVPEILLGKIEIVNIAREWGVRTKIIVRSLNLDDSDSPVRYFIGANGENIVKLKNILQTNEEIDFIRWSFIPEDLIRDALYPLRADEISEITINIDALIANVTVIRDDLIGVAVGSKGINIKLAENVTGYNKIIVHSLDNAELNSDIRKFLDNLPPINSGRVKIKDIARLNGQLVKVLVNSDETKTPAEECRKSNGSRKIINEIGENIHFIDWSNDPKEQIINALYPLERGEVKDVSLKLNEKKARVVVVTPQTRKNAVGKGGINVKLAEKLTGYKIEIIDED